jgi:nucleotide-binding universal stress UspA family protein
MPNFRNILFPVDLSEASPVVAAYVKIMAEKFNANTHLLFVARVMHHYVSMYVPNPFVNEFEQKLLTGAEKRLYEFKDQYFEGVKGVETAVLPGDPSEKILEFITDEKIDLVIMGTHGRQGLDKIMFGSVADRVVKSSPAPVMVINPFTTEG